MARRVTLRFNSSIPANPIISPVSTSYNCLQMHTFCNGAPPVYYSLLPWVNPQPTDPANPSGELVLHHDPANLCCIQLGAS